MASGGTGKTLPVTLQPGVMLKGTKDLIGRLHELRADTLAITGDLDAAAKCSRSIIMPREAAQ